MRRGREGGIPVSCFHRARRKARFSAIKADCERNCKLFAIRSAACMASSSTTPPVVVVLCVALSPFIPSPILAWSSSLQDGTLPMTAILSHRITKIGLRLDGDARATVTSVAKTEATFSSPSMDGKRAHISLNIVASACSHTVKSRSELK